MDSSPSSKDGKQPLDLLKRYRTLCEATGLARANRLALAPSAADELRRLEEQLRALLAGGPHPRPLSNAVGEGGSDGLAPGPSPREWSPIEAGQAPPPNPNPPSLPSPREWRRAGGEVPPPADGSVPVSPASSRNDDTATAPATALVFTDGAAEGNPGPGGYCAIVRVPGRPDRELSGGTPHTTNNKMELTAAIAGLREAVAAGATDVTVFADSEYLVKGMTRWLDGWARTGWKTSTGQPVKNRELWEQLAALTRGRSVRWQWVRGHAGHPENERCDRIATTRAREAALKG